jgi:type II secretory pathway pseudopilin PulG
MTADPRCSNDSIHPVSAIFGRNGRYLLLLRRVSPIAPASLCLQLTFFVSFNNWVCRNRLSTAARIVIAAVSFVIVSGIFLAYAMRRRRRIAQANMACARAAQNQQQGYNNQYPPPPQGGFFGMPFGGNGQKPQPDYGPQQHNGQYNPQYNDPQYNGQHDPQNNGQYDPQYNAPQYPPVVYDQGTPNQPVSTIPLSSSFSFSSLILQAPPYPGYAPPHSPPR